MSDKKEKFFKQVLICTACLGIGAGSTYLANKSKIDFMDRYPLILKAHKFAEETLEIKPPEEPSDDAVINAYFSLYDDKYTEYMGVEDVSSADHVTKMLNDSALSVGSGIDFKFDRDGKLTVADVVPDMAADKQGLQFGDRIIKVGEKNISEPEDAYAILGDDGEKTTLTVERGDDTLKIDLIRSCDKFGAAGVFGEMRGKTLYVRVETMSDYTPGRFTEFLECYDFSSLVLDLRNDGGGKTDASIVMADLFIDEATVYLTHNDGSIEELSTIDGKEYEVPIVLLVNGKTASSAEILTALLKQYADATIVGEYTFGKGIWQDGAFFNGGSLRYTEGIYTVGDWECYNGVGIAPDVEVEMDMSLIGTENDIQLAKAFEIIGENQQK